MTDAPRPPRPPGPRSIARTLALGSLAFVATLILLFGLSNVVRRGEAGGATATLPATGRPPATSGPSRAVGSSGPSASAPTDPGDPVLVGAGDIADCELDSDAATAALLDTIDGTVFTAADNTYPSGSAGQFRDCYAPTWGRHLARTRPAAGNHDWGTTSLAGYREYFGAAAGPADASWYSYEVGAWHVIVLDSDCTSVAGCGPESPQGLWLAADLDAAKARCILSIWHHPRFSSGEHGNDTSVAPFWRALYDDGADVVVNGHDHDYERFAPQSPDGREDRGRGIREFVVGTGGAALRGFPTVASNSELRASVTHGVLRLDLHRASYDWTFVPRAGGLGDSGSGPCH